MIRNMLLRIFFSLSFLLIPAHCLAEMPNSFEATVIADKSDYEGTLTWNGPDSGNEYWITDGSLNDERSVVYQALATENYRPRHYQHTEGVYEDVDDPTRALQDPTISEYFYVTHDVEKIANTTIAVGYDGTNLVLPVNEFQGFMLLSEPSEAIGSRPHFWTREADGQWTPSAIPLPAPFAAGEALAINNSGLIVGYANDGLENAPDTQKRARAFDTQGSGIDFIDMLQGTGYGPGGIAFHINSNNLVVGGYGDTLARNFDMAGFICELNPSSLLCDQTYTIATKDELQSNPSFYYPKKVIPRHVSEGTLQTGDSLFVAGTLQSEFIFMPPNDVGQDTPLTVGFVCKLNDASSGNPGHCDASNMFTVNPYLFDAECDGSGWLLSTQCRSDIFSVGQDGTFVGVREFINAEGDRDAVGIIGVYNELTGTWNVQDLNSLAITGTTNLIAALDLNANGDILAVDRLASGEKKLVLLTAPKPVISSVSQGDLTNAIDLRWEPMAGAESYRIYRLISPSSPDGEFILHKEIVQSDIPLSCQGPDCIFLDNMDLEQGLVHYYKVSAVIGAVETQQSMHAAGWLALDAPYDVDASGKRNETTGQLYDGLVGRIEVKWTAIPGAIGYRIFRRHSDTPAVTWDELAPNVSETLFIDYDIASYQPHDYRVLAIYPSATDASGQAIERLSGDHPNEDNIDLGYKRSGGGGGGGCGGSRHYSDEPATAFFGDPLEETFRHALLTTCALIAF